MDREKQAGKMIIGHIVAFIRCFPYVAIITRKNTEPNLAVILPFPSCCFFFQYLTRVYLHDKIIENAWGNNLTSRTYFNYCRQLPRWPWGSAMILRKSLWDNTVFICNRGIKKIKFRFAIRGVSCLVTRLYIKSFQSNNIVCIHTYIYMYMREKIIIIHRKARSIIHALIKNLNKL